MERDERERKRTNKLKQRVRKKEGKLVRERSD